MLWLLLVSTLGRPEFGQLRSFLGYKRRNWKTQLCLLGEAWLQAWAVPLPPSRCVVFLPFPPVDVLVFKVVGQPKTRTSVPLLGDGTGVKLGQSINV